MSTSRLLNVIDEQNSSEARGRRLKILREKTGITSIALSEKSGFSRVSISYWENGARSGLTRKAAEILVDIFSSLGLYCEIGWLWSGTGDEPRFISEKEIKNNRKNENLAESKSHIHKLISVREREIEFFLTLNTNSVIAKIEDDLMLPTFFHGDIVGGIWQPIHLISGQKNCILGVEDDLIVRTIKKTGQEVKISHLNKNANEYLMQKNIDASKFAAIIRMWR